MNTIFLNMQIVLFCALAWFKRYRAESTLNCPLSWCL